MKGIIEKGNKIDHALEKVRCLPRSPVFNSGRDSTKTRLVFDASSKSKDQISLNKSLYSGPCLPPHIYDITLLHCVEPKKTGIVANIKHAFLQINITAAHRNFL